MYLVLDLETTSNIIKDRVGNPFYNFILCYGLKYERSILTEGCLISKASDTMPNKWLERVDIIIGHNIKYDLLYLWKNEDLQKAFKHGLRIWDTQLAEYMLSGQKHRYPKLRDIAVNKYGCKERVKNIDEGFKQGLNTSNIDINLLLEDVKGDVLDTERVALSQVKQAKECGMYNLIKYQMDAVLATTEMEYNGMYINKTVFESQKQHIKSELSSRYDQLNEVIRRYW